MSCVRIHERSLGIHIERVSCVCGVCVCESVVDCCVVVRRILNKNEKCLLVIPAACKCTSVCEEDVDSDM